jgi:hypothetical protein
MNGIYGVILQKTELFIITTVRTSDTTQEILHYVKQNWNNSPKSIIQQYN